MTLSPEQIVHNIITSQKIGDGVRQIEDAIKINMEFARMSERAKAAEIARTQFLITPNGRDCGEHIAKLIVSQ